MGLPVINKPGSGEVFVDGYFVMFVAKTVTEKIAPTSGTITPTNSNVVLGSEVIYDSTGKLLTSAAEGGDYTVTKDSANLGCVTAFAGLAGTGEHTITYTYLVLAFGGATGLSMKEDFEQEEKPMGCSFSKIVVGKGSSKSFSFKDIAYVDDLQVDAALSGTYETGDGYARHTSGGAKDLSIVAFVYGEEAELVYGKELPQEAYIVENGKVKSFGRDISAAEKSFDITSSKHRKIKYISA
ncbi:hypothetical protein [Methanococcus maripaludis]|uniref:Uncharacterized protein n=1 Tax=Methanococcus maripaludis TaxID=39152 RepID=A0A8T4H5N5_METMI|nr:hypothetical protein [Methanococcus maripaludis]MBM7408776.1 hypothetical protein [Methanococcus maripaludis]MBP2219055.1 hypothetical protein [Methanococcus maripaludis]